MIGGTVDKRENIFLNTFDLLQLLFYLDNYNFRLMEPLFRFRESVTYRAYIVTEECSQQNIFIKLCHSVLYIIFLNLINLFRQF